MKEEINSVLNYLECEGETFRLRNWLVSLCASHPAELQRAVDQLNDAIKQTNIQSHEHVGIYYLFLGCTYYEQGEYQRAVHCLQSAVNELWGSQVNKALARWLLGLSYSNMQEFPKARRELQEALQLLATHKGTNSPRTDKEHRSRQTIRQNIKDAFERLFNEPLFRVVRPNPAQSADRFPTQDPPTDENDAPSISLDMPISVTNENYPAINIPVTVTNENYPLNKFNFNHPSSDVTSKTVKEEFNNTEKDYENRTDDEGYLVIHSVPVYEQYARAGKSGGPEPVISTSRFAEFHQVNIDGMLYTIHPLRSKANGVNVIKEGSWGWIKVKGKSMNEIKGNVSIDDGDYVLFQNNSNADDNDIVIAVHKGHNSNNFSTHVKRLRKSENTLYSETTAKGSEYNPIDMEESNMEIMGIVYAVAKPIPS